MKSRFELQLCFKPEIFIAAAFWQLVSEKKKLPRKSFEFFAIPFKIAPEKCIIRVEYLKEHLPEMGSEINTIQLKQNEM